MKQSFPLILRSGKTIESIDELMEFALQNPIQIKGEGFAISKWIECLGYSQEDRLNIEIKVHLATLGIKPNEITEGMLPDFKNGLIDKFTSYTGDTPPPAAKMGDRWKHPIDNSLMVFVPCGRFLRGTPKGQLQTILKKLSVPKDKIEDFFDETPEKIIYLDAFWIDTYPITNWQFALFLEESGFLKSNQREMERYMHIISHGKGKGADYPIHNISWYEAKAYCDWANKTLPTEAQWEKAARGGEDNRIFPWGNEVNLNIMNTIEKSHPFPDGVKVTENKKNISPYGCIQMAGNIYEWCLDWFDEKFYSRDITENPYCSEPTPQKVKVLRGGSTSKPIPYARCSCRDYAHPEIKADFTGFRTVWVTEV